MPVPPKPIKCHECGAQTLADRGRNGATVRVCVTNGHRGLWLGDKFQRSVEKARGRAAPRSGCWRCWCGRATLYMPVSRFIKIGKKKNAVCRVAKRRCPAGHRGWFRLAEDGGTLVQRVVQKRAKAR